MSDPFSAYNHLPIKQRQLCWAHRIGDLAAIAGRQGASGEIRSQLLDLQQQRVAHWHHWKDGLLAWPELQHRCHPIRLAFEATLERVVDLGCERGERTPWARTVRTCRQLLQRREALWMFLDSQGVEPTTNAAEPALRQSVIQGTISHGVQSASVAICCSQLLTVITIPRQQGRKIWPFLEQAWIAQQRGNAMPSLLQDV